MLFILAFFIQGYYNLEKTSQHWVGVQLYDHLLFFYNIIK